MGANPCNPGRAKSLDKTQQCLKADVLGESQPCEVADDRRRTNKVTRSDLTKKKATQTGARSTNSGRRHGGEPPATQEWTKWTTRICSWRRKQWGADPCNPGTGQGFGQDAALLKDLFARTGEPLQPWNGLRVCP